MIRSEPEAVVRWSLLALLLLVLAVTMAGCPAVPAGQEKMETRLMPRLARVEATPPVVEPERPAPPPLPQPAPRPRTPPQPAPEPSPPVRTVIKIQTARGDITAELYDEEAPITAGNFLLLAESGFYNGLTFHDVRAGFYAQGGDPNGNGTGGPGFTIPLEINDAITHDRGVLSMARADDPNSGGSQFFICLGSTSEVGGLDYAHAAFGRVTKGFEVLDELRNGDKIIKIAVLSESPYADAARKAARAARVPNR